ncbi:MAG TPA: sigma-54 dependent transcriptional regulator [Polyangiaceae bacterium]|jgi:two-component system response regulator HydG
MTDRVLVVDDDPDFRRFAELAVSRLGYETRSCGSADESLAILAAEAYDVVLVDVFLVGASGIELCSRIAERWENLPVVVMTAQGTLETAVDAIRAGAYDFVTKPPAPEALRIALERATAHRRMKDEVLRLRRAVKETTAFEEIVGASTAMKRVFDLVDRAADTDVSVLITGESGTGKELVARALHRRSTRSSRPFVALSCAAVPEHLLESELFGYVKGAFTDARAPRAGLLAQAAGGTLFLDEIGDMSLSLQPKLLRALQERKFRPVGGNEEQSFDARIITATNRDLETDVGEKKFREDLFYRINVVRIHLPPLRARGNDVLLIAQTLLERYASLNGRKVTGLTKAAAQRLLTYPWPGNVRELSNCIERAVALTRNEQLTVDDLPDSIRDYQRGQIGAPGTDVGPVDLVPLEDVERSYILRVLDAVGGNKTLASKVLGLDRKTLYRKLERYQALGDEAPGTPKPPDGQAKEPDRSRTP